MEQRRALLENGVPSLREPKWSISSVDISKSYRSRLSIILLGDADLGIATKP
jgi:hypothetical protein